MKLKNYNTGDIIRIHAKRETARGVSSKDGRFFNWSCWQLIDDKKGCA